MLHVSRPMGVCASSHVSRRRSFEKGGAMGAEAKMATHVSRRRSIEKGGAVAEVKTATGVPPSSSSSTSAKVIHMDGRLEEYVKPVKAWQVAVASPGCYVGSSEAMLVGQCVPGVPEEEDLQLGQLYFLLPLSAARQPLSLADLCRLAITASAAMGHFQLPTTKKVPPFPPRSTGI